MARPPELDENVLGGSILDYWPAMYGERGLEVDPPAAEPRRARGPGDPLVFVRRELPPSEEQERYSRKLRQAYNAWLAAGHLPGDPDDRAGEAAMASWKSYRERFMALGVIEGGGGRFVRHSSAGEAVVGGRGNERRQAGAARNPQAPAAGPG